VFKLSDTGSYCFTSCPNGKFYIYLDFMIDKISKGTWDNGNACINCIGNYRKCLSCTSISTCGRCASSLNFII